MARKKPAEQVAGRYSAVPHTLLDSVAFMGASYRAKALLYELVRQLNGSNNGHLQLTTSWLKKRGWPNADAIQKAKLELIERQLIVKTRLGGLNAGPDMWAVTWLVVSDCAGLDLRVGQHTPGAWHLFVEPKKQKKHSVQRNRVAPCNGTVPSSTAPYNGAKTAFLTASAAPYNGNNVFTNVPNAKGRKRIVGKPGKSGRKPTTQESVPTTKVQEPADYTRQRDTDTASDQRNTEQGKFVKALGQVPR
jgi:hypothetical protein